MAFPLCRIQRMPPRFVVLIAVSLASLIVVGCGVTNEGGSASDALTAELVVPPADQEVAAAPPGTQSPPTATTIPPTDDFENIEEPEMWNQSLRRAYQIVVTTRWVAKRRRSRCSIFRTFFDRTVGLGTAGR